MHRHWSLQGLAYLWRSLPLAVVGFAIGAWIAYPAGLAGRPIAGFTVDVGDMLEPGWLGAKTPGLADAVNRRNEHFRLIDIDASLRDIANCTTAIVNEQQRVAVEQQKVAEAQAAVKECYAEIYPNPTEAR